MESWLKLLLLQSLAYSFIIIVIISFLESLAIVGLFLPGIVFMSMIGTLIGNQTLNFYSAWIASTIGCLIGDWLSYFLGLKFKRCFHLFKNIKKYKLILLKIKNTVQNHSLATILIGRFIGPTRALIPMVSGMLKLPFKKFIIPDIIGCLLWPPIYFFPGIITGIVIDSPKYNEKDNYLKWIILTTFLIISMGIWLLWLNRNKNPNEFLTLSLSIKKINYIGITLILIGLISLILLQFHPKVSFFRHAILKIVSI
ncbi:DedA family protein [Buchnera aphidicola (Mindarus keteleerifoliae)]|uniref:DedA family protein n=1 Tax=Buchnera aphidicola TaxID=9 RepID=UPI0031B71E0B